MKQLFTAMKAHLWNHCMSQKLGRKMGSLVILFILIFFISFAIGRFYVPMGKVVLILLSQWIRVPQTWTDQMALVVLSIRWPRIMAATLIGMALSSAGCVYQGMFRNPMVSPDILGSSAGAGFGAALGILLGLGSVGVTILAFVFGIGAVVLALLCTMKYKQNPTLGLVLTGIMIGSLFSAGTSFVKLVADPTDQLPAITYWLMGSLASIRKEDLLLLGPCVLTGLIPLLLLRWRLNVLTQGDEAAMALGVNVRRLRVIVIICSTLMSAACVAVSGMIGWVGLVIPHFARKWVGCDYKYLLMAALFMGGSFLLVVDNIARTLATSEVPIGILTAFVGAPFFLSMILKGGSA